MRLRYEEKVIGALCDIDTPDALSARGGLVREMKIHTGIPGPSFIQ